MEKDFWKGKPMSEPVKDLITLFAFLACVVGAIFLKWRKREKKHAAGMAAEANQKEYGGEEDCYE